MMHCAVPGLPDTVLGLHPVFALQVTVPVIPPAGTGGCACPFWVKPLWGAAPLLITLTLPPSNAPLRPLTSPYSPSMVAVNVTDWPTSDGFWLEPTDVVEVACVMLKLLLCVLLEPL